MKKILLTASLLVLPSAQALSEPGAHPWLDKQLAKQRVKCPPGKSPFKGPEDAQVTIVEFLDYDCPFCADQEKVMKKVLDAYPTQVKLVIKNLPLDVHPHAKGKAIVADCMAMQGKFWQAHDALLAQEKKGKVRNGADQGKLEADIKADGDGQVDRDLAMAKRIGMATTPGFVIDGIRQGGAIGFNQFKLLIDAELARKSAAGGAGSGTANQ
jgi:protein-disulfide isomerase